ncbi:MAG: hypothetical protein ACOCRK_09600, partial [bacterium]
QIEGDVVTYTIKGPLLSVGLPTRGYLNYTMTSPGEDGFDVYTSKEVVSEENNIEDWKFDFTITGKNAEGKLYFNFRINMGGIVETVWKHNEFYPGIYAPSIYLNEDIPSIEIGKAESSIIIEPEWE